MTSDGAALRIRVADRGRGFDVARVLGERTLGLAGMRERVRLLGGRLTISSDGRSGTTLVAELPVVPTQTG